MLRRLDGEDVAEKSPIGFLPKKGKKKGENEGKNSLYQIFFLKPLNFLKNFFFKTE